MLEILPFLEARLREVTGLPAVRINPWVGEEAPHLQADHDLVLRLRGITPVGSWLDGGGRVTCHLTERLEVGVRTRLALDDAGSARVWLTHATLGHLRLRNLVLDALVHFIPEDADGDALTTSEIKLSPAQPPKAEGRAKQPVNWGEERLAFEVSYLQDLDPPRSLAPLPVEAP
jgi:hypothetical protein